MKVLIIEDDFEKAEQVRKAIFLDQDVEKIFITHVASINEALLALGSQEFDLTIADLVLPQMKDSLQKQDATEQWCDYISHCSSIRLSTWIIMTQFSDIATDARQTFARHGVAVLHYEAEGYWEKIISTKVKEFLVNPPLDFVVVCALSKERAGFEHCAGMTLGDFSPAGGLDCRLANLHDFKGAIIVLPETGLISAAIATQKAAQLFKPRAIVMSGICAGMPGESQLGDLIVPDLSWNYQSGKIVDGRLRPELMQVPIPPLTKTALQQLSVEQNSFSLRNNLFHNELLRRNILMPPMVSGSMVVADEDVRVLIAAQSRKVGALDMEVAAVYATAHDYFNGSGIFFAAKTVVDYADGSKDDRYHEYGCVLSARFICLALSSLLQG